MAAGLWCQVLARGVTGEAFVCWAPEVQAGMLVTNDPNNPKTIPGAPGAAGAALEQKAAVPRPRPTEQLMGLQGWLFMRIDWSRLWERAWSGVRACKAKGESRNDTGMTGGREGRAFPSC